MRTNFPSDAASAAFSSQILAVFRIAKLQFGSDVNNNFIPVAGV